MAEENMKTAAEEAAETCAEESVEETAAETAAENAEPEVEVVDNSAEEKIAMLTDQLQRIMAEFENFRKRTEKEKEARFDMGAKSVIEKILPVIDNFERGLGGVSEEQKEDPFVSGMDRVYRQMMTELEGIGVKAIEAEGKEFDPNRHNAVMHTEDDSVGENIVVKELQKGYTYRDSVVRYSMVQVAN